MSENSDSFIKLTEIPGRGRSLIASHHIKPGQIILRDSPVLVYPAAHNSNSTSSHSCSHCFRKINLSSQALSLTCPSCPNYTLFCNPNCKSAALSSFHFPFICQTLTRLRSSAHSLDPDLQTQLNFLIAAYNLSCISPSNFHLLLSLQGDSPVDAGTLTLHSILSSLIPHPTPWFSPELTAALLAKDKQNAFGIMEPFSGSGERLVRAYGIYPMASFFNHDCLPNACRFDYIDDEGDKNTDIIVRAIHDVVEGREICLSYFPVNWEYKDRQTRLLEDYGFVCNCDRCRVEKEWRDDGEEEVEGMEEDKDEEMEEEVEGNGGEEDDFPHAYFFVRYLCDRENCGGTLAPLPPVQGAVSNIMECNVCGKLREDNVDGDEGEGSVMLDE